MNRSEKIPDVVLVLAYGYPRLILSNIFLAAETEKILNQFSIPAFVERDIPLDRQLKGKFNLEIYGEENLDEYLSDLKIIRAFKKWLREKHPNAKNILLLTASPYQKRCILDLKREMPEMNILVDRFDDFPSDFWFSKQSTQWWTSRESLWDVREGIILTARKIYWPLYEKIMMA